MVLLYLAKVPPAMLCLWLGYSLRKLHELFNEAPRLRFMVFNIGIVGLPLAVLALVGAERNAAVATRTAEAVCLLYGVIASVVVMLFPRFKAVRHELRHVSPRQKLLQAAGLINVPNNHSMSSRTTPQSALLLHSGLGGPGGPIGGGNNSGNGGTPIGVGNGNGQLSPQPPPMNTAVMLVARTGINANNNNNSNNSPCVAGTDDIALGSATTAPPGSAMTTQTTVDRARLTGTATPTGNGNTFVARATALKLPGGGGSNAHTVPLPLSIPGNGAFFGNNGGPPSPLQLNGTIAIGGGHHHLHVPGGNNGAAYAIPSPPGSPGVVGGIVAGIGSNYSENTIRSALTRKAAQVQQLDFRLRELRRSAETTERELDRAQNEMHVAYMESEYQHMKQQGRGATPPVTTVAPLNHHLNDAKNTIDAAVTAAMVPTNGRRGGGTLAAPRSSNTLRPQISNATTGPNTLPNSASHHQGPSPTPIVMMTLMPGAVPGGPQTPPPTLPPQQQCVLVTAASSIHYDASSRAPTVTPNANTRRLGARTISNSPVTNNAIVGMALSSTTSVDPTTPSVAPLIRRLGTPPQSNVSSSSNYTPQQAPPQAGAMSPPALSQTLVVASLPTTTSNPSIAAATTSIRLRTNTTPPSNIPAAAAVGLPLPIANDVNAQNDIQITSPNSTTTSFLTRI
jgi:hypothetical protein